MGLFGFGLVLLGLSKQRVSTTQRRGWVYDPVMSPASKSASQAPKTGDAIHDFYTRFPPDALGSEVLFFSCILLA